MLIPPHISNLWYPILHVPQHCIQYGPGILPLKLSPRSEKKCLHWRTFVCLIDLIQGGDPVMAASEVEASAPGALPV